MSELQAETRTDKALEVSNPSAFKKRFGMNLKLFNDMLAYIGYMPMKSMIIDAIALARTYYQLENKKLPYSFFKPLSVRLLRKWGAMFHNYIKLYEKKSIRVANYLVGYGVGFAFTEGKHRIEKIREIREILPEKSNINIKDLRNRVRKTRINKDIGVGSVLAESLHQMVNNTAVNK